VQPLLLGQYGGWGAYAATPGGKKVCFALSKPSESQTVPANRPRDAAYMFVSSRPTEKVRDEVSIIMGYGFKPNSDANIDLAGTNYAMYTQNDGAWIKNAAEEARLIDSMRRGSDLVVKGVSARGTQSTDTYSLKGLAQALDRVAQECK
jgi:invasion protein IalB